ncbi:hypothetical protein ACJMK2_043693 [Sinanodonta woodiana]|uniref:Endonuclease/exonuclease/phosphatase domain-containing protein n=1 Tax=Sinanodonta woodiana TaxID=1069815 RepID=A0ABD3VXP3_SINWO
MMQKTTRVLAICSFILGTTFGYKYLEMKLVTMNAALQDSLPMKAERREALIKGVKASGADVVCLQEVFDKSDINRLKRELWNKYKYSFSFIHRSVTNLKKRKTPPCKGPEFPALLTCISSKCSEMEPRINQDPIAVYTCIQQQCASQFSKLSQECLACFLLRNDFNEALQLCHLNRLTMVNVPGLLLFSKNKILNAIAVEYHPNVTEITKRGYIQANIKKIGTVVCTHLSTPFLGNLYPEAFHKYGNYSVQNMAEVHKLLAAVKGITPLVLAGDFNTGPEQPDSDVCAELPESYNVLTSSEARLVPTTINKCTFCTGNTWLKQDCSCTIDHIFLRGHTLKCITRILDDPYVQKQHYLSDHYGVMATVIVRWTKDKQ